MRKPIMPNKNNRPNLSAPKAAAATAAIKNLIPTIKSVPPVTAADRAKMEVAKVALAAEIKKTQAAAAKNAVGKTAATPAAQLAAQQTKIGSSIPSIAKFLPPEIAPADITFATAIESMRNSILQLDVLIANPVTGAAAEVPAPAAPTFG
jgi:hypothetical protein